MTIKIEGYKGSKSNRICRDDLIIGASFNYGRSVHTLEILGFDKEYLTGTELLEVKKRGKITFMHYIHILAILNRVDD